MSRLPTLDGVRGVAALMVLVGHAANDGYLPGILGHGSGQMAVGVFFLLSGFLMAYLYGDTPVSGMPAYAIHRFARVVPLYLVIVLISITVHSDIIWTFPISGADEAARHLLFVHGVDTLWTIPVEIQFYVVFCLIWISPKLAFPFLLGAQVISAAMFWMAGLPTSTLPFWLHFFLFGSATGLIWRRHSTVLLERTRDYAHLGWIILIGAILALPGIRWSLGIPLLPNFVDPITVAGAAALFLGALLQLGPLAHFSSAWARWLGKISYGVYLIHFPVLMTIEGLRPPAWTVFPMALAITLLLATASFEFFEEPLRRRMVAWVRKPHLRKSDHATLDGGVTSSEKISTESAR